MFEYVAMVGLVYVIVQSIKDIFSDKKQITYKKTKNKNRAA